MSLKLQQVTLQLVFARSANRDYPLVDLTYWTKHDVLDQKNLMTRSLEVCPRCYGPVDRGVCLRCYAEFPGSEGEEVWEGLLLSGAKRFVATKLAELWYALPYPSDVTSVYLPFPVDGEKTFLSLARSPEVDDLMECGNYRVYQADTIVRDLATGVALYALLEAFLEL